MDDENLHQDLDADLDPDKELELGNGEDDFRGILDDEDEYDPDSRFT